MHKMMEEKISDTMDNISSHQQLTNSTNRITYLTLTLDLAPFPPPFMRIEFDKYFAP